MNSEKLADANKVRSHARKHVRSAFYSPKFALAGLAAMILFAIGLLLGNTRSYQTGHAEADLPVLHGEAAITDLKRNGTFDSLSEAVTAARYMADANKTGIAAVNEANDLQMDYTESGLRLSSTVKDSSWISDWKLNSLGYGVDQTAAAVGSLRSNGNRVELRRDGQNLTEWYENSPKGVEHGFTLDERPDSRSNGDALRLVMKLSGDLTAKADDDGQALTLFKKAGDEALRYEKLKVWDADGRELTSRMRTASDEVWFDVDDKSAAYPITIDPTFIQPQKLVAAGGLAGDEFGGAVAISGDTAVIGATADSGNGLGSVYVFVQSGTTWSLQQKLTASDGVAFDSFGTYVAIDGETVIVGASADTIGVNTNQGSAYIFTRSGTVWTQQQKLTSNDGASFDFFGRSIAIAGDTAVVGAPSSNIGVNNDQGSAYVFVRAGTTWTQQQKLTAGDGAANDAFGDSVAISGESVIVGATDDTTGTNTQQGSAYVFVRGGTLWTQQQRLTASDGAVFDSFGFSVAIAGDTAVVGTLQNVGANFQQGSAYVFVRGGTAWTQQQKLLASDGAAGDTFGNSVSISGEMAVVGAAGDTAGTNQRQGSAYLFSRGGRVWTELQKITAADGGVDDSFGSSVALSGNRLIVGALGDTIGANQYQGSAYVYQAHVTVAGRVVTPSGLNLRNAVVTMTDSLGVRRSVTTSSFGLYSFDNVRTGETYVIGVSSKRYRFAAITLLINSDLTNVNFMGLE